MHSQWSLVLHEIRILFVHQSILFVCPFTPFLLSSNLLLRIMFPVALFDHSKIQSILSSLAPSVCLVLAVTENSQIVLLFLIQFVYLPSKPSTLEHNSPTINELAVPNNHICCIEQSLLHRFHLSENASLARTNFSYHWHV